MFKRKEKKLSFLLRVLNYSFQRHTFVEISLQSCIALKHQVTRLKPFLWEMRYDSKRWRVKLRTQRHAATHLKALPAEELQKKENTHMHLAQDTNGRASPVRKVLRCQCQMCHWLQSRSVLAQPTSRKHFLTRFTCLPWNAVFLSESHIPVKSLRPSSYIFSSLCLLFQWERRGKNKKRKGVWACVSRVILTATWK